MIKSILKSILRAIIEGLMAWAVAMIVSKLQDVIYDKFIKKPFCIICGGSGYKSKDVKCHCRDKKKHVRRHNG